MNSIKRMPPLISASGISMGLIGALLMAPISSSIESIFLIFALVGVLLNPDYRSNALSYVSNPWCLSGFLLFLISLFGCAWTSASFHDAWVVVGKYSKLLYLPLLVAGFRSRETRFLAMHAFLLAMLVTCVISFLKLAHILHYHGDDPAHVFRNHIMTGYMMAFAAYLCALFFTKSTGKTRVLYGVLSALFSYHVLFIGMGRTSYLIYFVLMLILVLHVFSWKQALAGVLIVCALFTLVYQTSDIMQHRAQEAMGDWRSYHQNTEKNTPVGYRLQFHAFAHTLFDRHPWVGNGTSGFSDAFQKEHPVPGWGETLFEPHSQYWLIAADFGLLGLVALGLFFGSLFMASRHCSDLTRPIAIGLLLSFLLGSGLDSLLLYSATGYFFLLFMALCLADKQWNSIINASQFKRTIIGAFYLYIRM